MASRQDKDVHVSTNLNKSGMANRKDDDVNVCTYSSNMADRDKESVNVVQAPTKRKRAETSGHSHCCVPECTSDKRYGIENKLLSLIKTSQEDLELSVFWIQMTL